MNADLKPPMRTQLDLDVDRSWHELMAAETLELKLIRCKKFTEAIKKRIAARTPEEIAQIEHDKRLFPWESRTGA